MKGLAERINGHLRDYMDVLEEAIVQPVITVHRDLPKPHVEPAALPMLKGLLRGERSSTKPPKVVMVCGEKGTGKSILSILVARDLKKEGIFKGVYRYPLIKLQRSDPLMEVACTLQLWLASRLGHKQQGTRDPETLHGALDALFNSTLQSRNHLVVVDDAWDQYLVNMLRCDHLKGALLVTSQGSLWPDQQHEVTVSSDPAAAAWPVAAEDALSYTVLEVKLLPQNMMPEAGELMDLILTPSKTISSLPEPHKGIAAEVLKLCGGNLEATAIMSHALAKDKELWVQKRNMLRDTVGDKMNGAIGISVTALQGSADISSRRAAAVFLMLRHVQAEYMMPVPLVQLLIKCFAPHTLQGEAVDWKGAQDLLDKLVCQSLLNKGSMSLLGNTKPTYFTSSVVDIYLGMQAAADKDKFAALVKAEAGAEQRQLALVLLVYGRQPAATWACSLLLGEKSEAATSTPLLSSAERLAAVLCLDDEQGVLSWGIGRLMAQAGRYTAARMLFEQALQRQPNDPGSLLKLPELALYRARTTRSLAAVYFEEAMATTKPELLPAADAFAHEALKQMEAQGISQGEIANACNTLGAVKAGRRQYAEAEALFRRALKVNEALKGCGPLDNATIINQNNLGYVLVELGKLDEARAQLEVALASAQEAHKRTRTHAVVLDTMGLLLKVEKKPAEAIQYYRNSLEMKEKVLPGGPGHAMTKKTKQRLDELLLAQQAAGAGQQEGSKPKKIAGQQEGSKPKESAGQQEGSKPKQQAKQGLLQKLQK